MQRIAPSSYKRYISDMTDEKLIIYEDKKAKIFAWVMWLIAIPTIAFTFSLFIDKSLRIVLLVMVSNFLVWEVFRVTKGYISIIGDQLIVIQKRQKSRKIFIDIKDINFFNNKKVKTKSGEVYRLPFWGYATAEMSKIKTELKI
jgi:hypothetical protein